MTGRSGASGSTPSTPAVAVLIGESVRMDLTVENKGKQDEVIALKLGAVPKGWKASLA